MDPVYRLLGNLKALAQTVPDMETTLSRAQKDRLKTMGKLYADNVTNSHWQTATHFGTAAFCFAAAVWATSHGFDATSAITVTSKLGEGTTTWIRGFETEITGQLRLIEHEVNRGSDAGKRFTEMFQQFMRNVETTSQLRSRIRVAQ